MKCQEANEWMNRYLDQDLSEAEQKQLFQHLDSCPECAETFDLLKRISTQLDNLPDVKPRFSLVDSILPQLDELERQGEQAAETKSEIAPVPELMKPFMTAEDLEPSIEKRESRIKSVRRKRQLWTRIGAGAAAAVILGFCIYQFQPKEIPNAEPPVQESLASSALDAVNPEPSASSALPETSAQPGTSAAPKVSSSDQTPAAADQSQIPAAPNQQSAQAPETGAGASAPAVSGSNTPDKANGTGQSSSEPSVKQDTGRTLSQITESAPSASGTSSDAASSEPASTEPNQMEKAPVDSDSASDSRQDPGVGSSASIQSIAPPMSFDSKKSSNSIMGIQSQVTESVWDSPNGKYVAKLEEGHLNVYLISTDSMVKIYDDPVTGEWQAESASWSSDGSKFYYTVIENGKSVDSQVDADQAAAAAQK